MSKLAAIVTVLLAGLLEQALGQGQYGILPADFDEQLDKVLTKLPFTFKSQGADKQGCKADLDDAEISCPGLSAQLAVYEADNGRTYEVTICTCPGGPYDANGLASLVSGIPQFLLYFVKGVTSVNHPGGITGMAERTGQMQVYTSVDTRVVIYEAAHAQDYAAGIMDSHFTSTSTWQQAVSESSCSATPWSAQTGAVNEFADATLPYIYNLYHGSPSFNTSCLQPELEAIGTYAHSLSSSKK